jgi:hypothetical protein
MINLHVTYEGLGQKRSSDRTPLGGDLNRKEGYEGVDKK